jgi:Xaa-Pro aminopeptidase
VKPSLQHVRDLLARFEIAGILITAPTDLRYVTGLSLSTGVVFISKEQASLFVDPRYVLMARDLSSDFHVACYATPAEETAALHQLFNSFENPIAFDASTTSVEKFQELASIALPSQLVASAPLFSHLRHPKRADEIMAIQEACNLCEKGFNALLGSIREGVTEAQLAQALKAFWFSQGAEALSFEPIIAFGPHSACPHWTSSSTPLARGTVILIDIGVQLHSYHSDMTRTIFFGNPDPQAVECHCIVQEAYMEAFSKARPGIDPYLLDGAARDYLASKGLGDVFVHGLGHGVGLQVHERPRVSRGAVHEPSLQIGDVITIEPGVYLEGKWGIRIENTVVIEESGARSFFSVPIQPVFL